MPEPAAEPKSYHDRKPIVHVDGTLIFGNPADRKREDEAAVELAKYWSTDGSKCSVNRFGALSPIDFFAERDERVVGLLELKGTYANQKGEDVTYAWLNVRKWLALSLGSLGMGTPAIFVCKFLDGLRWIPLQDIDASRHRIAGCKKIVKSMSDIEPVIEVKVADMRIVK